MTAFTLCLQDARQMQQVDNVTAFVGEDASGSFSFRAHHEHSLTLLVPGLARFQTGSNSWQYLALPGGLLYFRDNRLTVSTRRFYLGDDYRQMEQALREHLLAEETNLHDIKASLHRMEDTLLKRLYEMGREGS